MNAIEAVYARHLQDTGRAPSLEINGLDTAALTADVALLTDEAGVDRDIAIDAVATVNGLLPIALHAVLNDVDPAATGPTTNQIGAPVQTPTDITQRTPERKLVVLPDGQSVRLDAPTSVVANFRANLKVALDDIDQELERRGVTVLDRDAA